MRLKVFIKGDEPIMRDTEELVNRLKDTVNADIEFIDTESKEATSVVEVYEIFSTPSFLVTTDDGSVVHSWMGELPMEDDIRRYLSS